MTDYNITVFIDGVEFHDEEEARRELLDRLDEDNKFTAYSDDDVEVSAKNHIHPMGLDAFCRVSTPIGEDEDFAEPYDAVEHALSILYNRVSE